MKPRTRKEREVWEALNYLYGQNHPGQNLTGELIGDCLIRLGYNRGSNADIYRYKKTWLLAQSGANDDLPELNSPLSDPISKAAATLREKLEAEAQAKIDKIQQASKEKYQLARAQIERLEQSLSDAQTKQEELEQQKSDLDANCQALSDELQQTRSNYRDALEQEKCLTGQLDTLRTTHQQHRDELKNAHQQSIAECHQQQADQGLKYQQMLDQLKIEIKEKEVSHAALQQLKDASIDHLKSQLNKIQHKIDTKEKMIQQLTTTLNTKTSEFEMEKTRSLDTITHQNEQLKQLKEEVASKNLTIATLEAELRQTTSNLHQLKEWNAGSRADFNIVLKKLNDLETKMIRQMVAAS